MSKTALPDRCRLVLIAPPEGDIGACVAKVESALEGGDVASLIIPVGGRDEASLQKLGEALLPLAQAKGVAVMIENDTRIAGRIKADGVHLETSAADLAEQIEHLDGRLMVGAGGIKTRDEALDLGEAQPDYVFFGRFGYDNKPEAHSRNLKLAEWWSEMISLPCVVLGGTDIASALAVAETRADFVALSAAVFDGANGTPAQAVAAVNALLDQSAPRFTE
ncbi:thiamine phosphate synthase [Tianweitania sp. BSSL-BM11]|uniref:Thiamine phosphate synthase n=1 Tax=Tianweitania aestuarii TaxID=2814886 RepID=A0ABS5S258_9HYPH|nr:thiamine phosphate synthase [Tianweitania aestuarii]MBS9722579.1 thiamine phosphate synthase [Tianweitania aestuarii]